VTRVGLMGWIVGGALIAGGGAAAAAAQPASAAVPVKVAGTPSGRAMPRGFVGVSFEFNGLASYTGNDPSAVNPVLVALLRALAPGSQRPVVRIGGNSTDYSWWPVRGMTRPAGIRYRLTRGWLESTRALARRLNARLIMGVNLEAGRPRFAVAEAHQFLPVIGRRYVQALEIGNEPDLYAVHPWYTTRRGDPVFARPSTYGFPQFMSQFTRWSRALPAYPLAGPSLASTAWFHDLDEYASRARRLRMVTVHRYPLSACNHNPRSPGYPTIGRLLTGQSVASLAGEVVPAVRTAHHRGLALRLDEMNSVSCSGRAGVSDTFASALWIADTLFALARVGVDGVNVHTWPGAAYQLFSFSDPGGRWQAFVAPEYYGMLMFERAFPPGARLLPVSVGSHAKEVRAWATRGHGGHTRVVLINDDRSAAHTMRLRLAGGVHGPATLEWLRAPHAGSRSHVTLGGQSFGDATSTGHLAGRPSTPSLRPARGRYTVRLPPASALLLRF
jgi:hypothetical protein